MSSKRFSRFLDPSITIPLLQGDEPRPNPDISVSSAPGNSTPNEVSPGSSSIGNEAPPSGPGPAFTADNTSRASKAITKIFERVNTVRNVASRNIEQLVKRDEEVHELGEVSKNLEGGGQNFSKASEQMKKKYKDQNRNFMIGLIVCSCIALMTVIIWLIVAFS